MVYFFLFIIFDDNVILDNIANLASLSSMQMFIPECSTKMTQTDLRSLKNSLCHGLWLFTPLITDRIPFSCHWQDYLSAGGVVVPTPNPSPSWRIRGVCLVSPTWPVRLGWTSMVRVGPGFWVPLLQGSYTFGIRYLNLRWNLGIKQWISRSSDFYKQSEQQRRRARFG